jgi:hypothetical protein
MANPKDVQVRERKKQEAPKQEESKKSSKALIVILIVLVLALVGVIVWLLLSQKPAETEQPPSEPEKKVDTSERGFVVERDNVEDVQEEIGDKVEKGMFECEMNMEWDYSQGGKVSENAYVANSVNNTYTIYFDVIDRATEEILYKSPYIPVGKDIHGFALDKTLDPGTYEAIVQYTLVDQDNDYEEISTAGFVVKINVTD